MLARSELDFTLKAERSHAPRRGQGIATLVLSRIMHPRVLRLIGLTGFLVFVAIVAINALVLQKGPHPAPLLGVTGSSLPARPSATAKPVKIEAIQSPAVVDPAQPSGTEGKLAPALPAPPAQTPLAAVSPALGGPSALVPPPRPRPANTNLPSERPHDPIARLLGANDGIGAGLEPTKTVLMAQRALLKVGYVIRPDGMMGATTRQALQQFERDRGLPVTGDLSVRVRRELSALSGIPVE